MNGPGVQIPAPSPGADRRTVGRDALVRVEAELTGVEQALTHLDDGTYGTCEQCRARLHDDDLAIDPLARRCPDHRSSN
jgi:RNA polymerase-binding transcription factor DksA